MATPPSATAASSPVSSFFCLETAYLAWPHLRSKESWEALELLEVLGSEPYPLCAANAAPLTALWCWSCCHTSPLRPPMGTMSSSARLGAPITTGVLAVVDAAGVPKGRGALGRCRADNGIPSRARMSKREARAWEQREDKTSSDGTRPAVVVRMRMPAHETCHTRVRAKWVGLALNDVWEGETRGSCYNTVVPSPFTTSSRSRWCRGLFQVYESCTTSLLRTWSRGNLLIFHLHVSPRKLPSAGVIAS